MPNRPTTPGDSYSHRKPYLTERSIPRKTIDAHNERELRGAFSSAYQALADTFRSDVFAANFHSEMDPWGQVERYLLSANERAVEAFRRVLTPVGNIGAVLGRDQAEHGPKWYRRFYKASGSSAARADSGYGGGATAGERARTGGQLGSITPLYPGSYPVQVPPRRRLLRIPRPSIDIQPAIGGRGRFTGAPQVHLDAIANLPLDLVVMINEGQVDGIRAALDEAVRRGYDADMLGMQIANMVGLFPRWQLAVANLEDRMIAQGRPAKEIHYRVGRYSDWLRERRGIMIARSEMMTALNTGRMAGWMEQADQGFLDPALSVKEWLAAPGACDLCSELNGTTVQGVDGEFDTGKFGKVKSGPCHPGCRCTILIHPVRRPDQYLD